MGSNAEWAVGRLVSGWGWGMSPRVRRTFRVRSYEVGPTGGAHHAVILNWCQETAYDGSAALGYPPEFYAALGTFWVMRAVEVVFESSPRYNDEVEVTTWISDVRRVRCHREYELRVVGAALPFARARADWVFLDQATGAPRRIPAELLEVFAPDGTTALLPHEWGAMGDPIAPSFTTRRRVQYHELDALDHVNNAVYVNWIEQQARDAWAAWGHDPARLCLTRHALEYLRSALPDDEVALTSRVTPHGAGLRWEQTVQRGDELLVVARSLSAG